MTFFQGLVFKWGSLVGISIPDSGANGSSPFVAGDVVFRPREFTTAITTWATVPYCTTDFAPYNNTATDHLSRAHTPANIARGIGDICRHLGVVEGTRWRIPTQSEWNELYGSKTTNGGNAESMPKTGGWVLGSFHPLSGYALGPHQSRITIISNTQVDNANPNTDGAVFLSANGLRANTNGAIWSIGLQGHCWSSTAQSAVNGYDMTFEPSTVMPQNSNSRTYARSVRCIRE